MGTLFHIVLVASFAYVAADGESEMKQRFDVELKRSVAISDAPEDSGHNEELESSVPDFGIDEEKARVVETLMKRFDLYKRFDPLSKRFSPYDKRFDPFDKRFDPLQKRFDPFQKRFDIYKRFDPFSKRFDPLYKRFDPFFKRFDPFMNKRFDREEVVRNLLRSLSQSKRNIMDPRAFNIGFGR